VATSQDRQPRWPTDPLAILTAVEPTHTLLAGSIHTSRQLQACSAHIIDRGCPRERELRPRGNAAPPSAHIAGEEHSPNSWVAKVLASGTRVETRAGSLLARADVLTPRRSTSPGGEHGCAGHGLIPEAQRGTVIPANRGPRCPRLRWYFVSIEITMARRSSSRVLHRRVSRMFFFGEVKNDVAKLARVELRHCKNLQARPKPHRSGANQSLGSLHRTDRQVLNGNHCRVRQSGVRSGRGD
jgi:hypothetical protein